MFKRNLTAKILVAVGVTVAAVIAIYTYFVIRVQSAWWHERTQAQNLNATSLIHEYLSGVMLSDRHKEVQGFLEKLKARDEIWRARLIKPDGTVVFSTDTQEVQRAVLTAPADLFTGNQDLLGTRIENGQRLSVVMHPVLNGAGCQRCHDPKAAVIGAIVVEKSLAPAEASVASNRNLLIVYGAVIFTLVGVVLWLLIVRLVTQPVGNVLEQMRSVQAGDLSARAAAETSDEIGELAHGFNAMVRSLRKATRQLEESHEKQIQQAGKLAAIGELASGIAHEIRNPLAGIRAAAEVLAEDNGLNGQRPEIVAEIRHQITRLNGTLDDLLGFVRRRDPEMVPCAVPDLIKPMLALARPDAQQQQIAIAEQYATDLPPIRADAGQVQQALLNLFLNAIQAMPNGGTLTVRAEPVGDHVRLTISDTGVGISPDNLPKIFSPFFTTKHRGTGLGLAITRAIVEKHRGAISVETECGRGTAFTLEFVACTPSECRALLEVTGHGTYENSHH